jgi:murein DD-endopeptidase MepM/ murein hydrolase activator NlpD
VNPWILTVGLFVPLAGLACERGLGERPRTCDPRKHECADGELCSRGVREPFSWGYCILSKAPAEEPVLLPIASADGVKCSHGGLDGDGTHSYLNSLFAVDLATPYDGAPGVVVAAQSGTVSALNAVCRDPGKSVGHADDCGQGFGNWIRLAHTDGTATFYAHLSTVEVSLGQALAEGQRLGHEGTTGRAGFRHLHFAVQRAFKTDNPTDDAWQSIDFKLVARPGTQRTASRILTLSDLRCGLPSSSLTLFPVEPPSHRDSPTDMALPSSSIGPRR